jgi:hypothetical protein
MVGYPFFLTTPTSFIRAAPVALPELDVRLAGYGTLRRDAPSAQTPPDLMAKRGFGVSRTASGAASDGAQTRSAPEHRRLQGVQVDHAA